MSKLLIAAREAWQWWKLSGNHDKELAQLQRLKIHLEERRAQLETLRALREEMAADERAKLENVLGGMLQQQRMEHERAKKEESISSLDPTFLKDASAVGTSGEPQGPDTAGRSNVMEQEVSALMHILGSQSFTILEEDGAETQEQQARQRSGSGDSEASGNHGARDPP